MLTAQRHKRLHLIVAVLFFCFQLASCGPSKGELATATAQAESILATSSHQTQVVADAEATNAAETQQSASATVAAETQAAQQATDAAEQATQAAAATSSAGTATAEFQQAATATEKYVASVTKSARETATQEARIAVATSTGSELYGLVNELADGGYISTTAGTYHPLNSFRKSWAQLYWYQWWDSGFAPDNFVIKAHAAMDSATTYSDSLSGCLIIFRENGVDDHYLFRVTMYGWAGIERSTKNGFVKVGNGYYGNINERTPELDFALAVDGDIMSAFINGEKTFKTNYNGINSGALGFGLVSATNKSFGTSCELTDIELWILE